MCVFERGGRAAAGYGLSRKARGYLAEGEYRYSKAWFCECWGLSGLINRVSG